MKGYDSIIVIDEQDISDFKKEQKKDALERLETSGVLLVVTKGISIPSICNIIDIVNQHTIDGAQQKEDYKWEN